MLYIGRAANPTTILQSSPMGAQMGRPPKVNAPLYVATLFGRCVHWSLRMATQSVAVSGMRQARLELHGFERSVRIEGEELGAFEGRGWR